MVQGTTEEGGISSLTFIVSLVKKKVWGKFPNLVCGTDRWATTASLGDTRFEFENFCGKHKMRRWQSWIIWVWDTNLNEFFEIIKKIPRISIESKTSFSSKYSFAIGPFTHKYVTNISFPKSMALWSRFYTFLTFWIYNLKHFWAIFLWLELGHQLKNQTLSMFFMLRVGKVKFGGEVLFQPGSQMMTSF